MFSGKFDIGEILIAHLEITAPIYRLRRTTAEEDVSYAPINAKAWIIQFSAPVSIALVGR
jgi:hypothetical protein